MEDVLNFFRILVFIILGGGGGGYLRLEVVQAFIKTSLKATTTKGVKVWSEFS
jgi:hypothetical protein